jgi:hypothetical protein
MQVMEAPVRVLKGLAASAGKIMGVADRRKAKAASKAATAEPDAAEAVAPQAAPAEPATSGNVRVVTPEPAAAEAVVTEPAAPEAVVAEPAAAEAAPAAEEPAPAEPAKAAAKKAAAKKDDKPAEAPAGDATSELPLANYDALTVNSLRARMTKLSPDQLTVLIEYEKAHQGREDIVGMLERRVIRINSGQTTSFQAVK